MDAAWELGLQWFDTADAYGGGRSEQWIGDWIRATGNRPRITTKTFNPMEEGADHGLGASVSCGRSRPAWNGSASTGRPLPRARAGPGHAGRRDVRGVRGAARAWRDRRLGHLELRRRRAARVARGSARRRSSRTPSRCSTAATSDELIPLCREHGIAYQAFSPLAGGWLTGKYRRDAEPPAGSRMTMRPGAVQGVRDRGDLRRDRGVRAEGATSSGSAPGGLALAWPLGEADSVVTGPRRPAHLDQAREALGLELSPEQRDEVGSLFPC